MVLKINLTIDGEDYHKLFMRSHSEQTTSASKDENKYDVTLANGGGSLFGKFKPKSIIELSVDNIRATCEGTQTEHIHIFTGEVQKVSCDEEECHIEGSCPQGGMVSALREPRTWTPGTTITECVKNLLRDFGVTEIGVIQAANDVSTKHNPEVKMTEDFNTAIKTLADESGVNWFFDEHGKFWFVPGSYVRAARDLTHHVLKGQTASNMMGVCTVVDVYGWSQYTPDTPESNNFTHSQIHARKRADEADIIELMQGENMLVNYGVLLAPPIVVPNCDQKTCENIAKNMLLWYLQFKDVPQVKVEGCAPVVQSAVAYSPFNGRSPPISCNGSEDAIGVAPIKGLVIKRVVDISPDIGIECTMDISTNYMGARLQTDVVKDPVQAAEIINPYKDVYNIWSSEDEESVA